MKKLLTVGLLTICALACSAGQSQAWINCKFGIGLNFQFQSGNNTWLWGLFTNGQVPPAYGLLGPPPPAFFPGVEVPDVMLHAAAPYESAPVYAGQPQQQPYSYASQGYNQNPYHTTGYQPSNNYYPTYSNPGYNFQVPSYWYQGR